MTEPMSREQVDRAFLGLYEQHKADVGTTTTLVLLQGHIHALADRLAESEEISQFYEGLVTRANIGTEEMPSLRAYVEQLEQKLAESERRKEGA